MECSDRPIIADLDRQAIPGCRAGGGGPRTGIDRARVHGRSQDDPKTEKQPVPGKDQGPIDAGQARRHRQGNVGDPLAAQLLEQGDLDRDLGRVGVSGRPSGSIAQ